MLRYICKILFTFALTVAISVIGKIVFVFCHTDIYDPFGMRQIMAAIVHGLPMDCTIAAYISILPAILAIAHLWTDSRLLSAIERAYFIIVSLLCGIVFVLDTALYTHWGFKLDMTPIFYFITSPAAVIGGMTAAQKAGGLSCIVLSAVIIYLLYNHAVIRLQLPRPNRDARLKATAVMILATALLFIPLRGGFTVSTMNPGRAYFSPEMKLNHAATNPVFNLLYSATHQNKELKTLNSIDDRQLADLEPHLIATSLRQCIPDTTLLSASRPDIYIILLESFSTHLMPSMGGEAIATRLDSIASAGLSFTEFYANSFRTDRALASVLSAYPGIPTVSVMRSVGKIESLPSLPLALKDAGYDLTYYYGGDINFTNMRALLAAGGFSRIVSDTDFPITQRLGKWGAHDDILFSRVEHDLASARDNSAPRLTVIQTSSSHEPFDVPATILPGKEANAFAFTDSIVGRFVDNLSLTPRWDSTLVVLVADHYGCHPRNLTSMRDRHHIPLVMTGGALRRHGTIDIPASQTDIAATLLGMLGIDHSRFTFSKDIFDSSSPKFAYFARPEEAAMLDTCGYHVIDIYTGGTLENEGISDSTLLRLKAYLQLLNHDFNQR